MTMPTLTVSETRPLQFSDSAGCERWVAQLPLTNIQQSRRLLSAQIAALDAARLPALERLHMLETLLEPITFVQSESAQRYLGKPLPLDADEAATWRGAIELWEGLTRNYHQCLAAYRSGDIAVAPHAALITARLMRSIDCRMIEHYRVYRAVPGELWGELHALYLLAEQHDFLHARVADAAHPHGRESSCAEIFMHALLTHLANPYGLSARQLGFLLRWAEKWARLAKLSAKPLPVLASPALAVDLDGVAGPTFAGGLDPASNLRYLDVEALAKALRQTITALKQGQLPARLGLGSNAHQPGCESLLMLLYVQWCRAGTGRIEEREASDAEASICFGLPAAHFQLRGGREFRQPGDLTAREKWDLDIFGYVVRTPHERSQRDEFPFETWKVANHSPSGFMCVQNDSRACRRMSHNQLVAVRRGTPAEVRTGVVQWMRVEADGELRCGVRLFPGSPQAVAVRPADVRRSGSRYEQALLVAADPATGTPATLILPPGWFEAGALIEVVNDQHRVATMLTLLEKGGDFDRGTVALI
jgi:hypothetical protein